MPQQSWGFFIGHPNLTWSFLRSNGQFGEARTLAGACFEHGCSQMLKACSGSAYSLFLEGIFAGCFEQCFGFLVIVFEGAEFFCGLFVEGRALDFFESLADSFLTWFALSQLAGS